MDNPVIDLAALAEDSAYWRVDAVICTLGTAIKVAGSQAAFAAVDRDLPVRVARCARQAGANGAVWLASIARAAKNNDETAVRKNLAAIAASARFDLYWNATIVHATEAVLKTKTIDSTTALTVTIGVAAAMAIPPYQPIVNACKEASLKDSEMLQPAAK